MSMAEAPDLGVSMPRNPTQALIWVVQQVVSLPHHDVGPQAQWSHCWGLAPPSQMLLC